MKRIVARLDIKGDKVIKGIQLEGLRVVGDPVELAERYYLDGVDEFVFVDAVASLYGRNTLSDVIRGMSRKVFVPITVVGGIRNVNDARSVLRAGADKVGINTAAVQNPNLLTELASQFGRQSIVLSVEAKRVGPKSWEVYCDSGREPSGMEVVGWARSAVEYGAGELFVTSIDQDGTQQGTDLDLMAALASALPVPVVASGGVGQLSHVVDILNYSDVSAVAIASALHYDKLTIRDIKKELCDKGFCVRNTL